MTRWQIGIGVAAAAAVVAMALRPEPLLRLFPRYGAVVHHLPGDRLDTGDPIYFHAGYRRPARVDTSAIRRAGTLVPDNAIYAVRGPAYGQTGGNIMLAARLFFLPAVQTRRPEAANWILSYRSRPSKAPSRHVYELDPDLTLTHVR
jgi:hypothetical protein